MLEMFRNPIDIILIFFLLRIYNFCICKQTFSLQLAYHCCIFIRDLPCLIIATWSVSWSYFIRGCTRVIKVSGLQTEIVARRFSSRGRSSRRCGIVARGSFVDRGLGETVRSDRRWVSTGSIWFYFGKKRNSYTDRRFAFYRVTDTDRRYRATEKLLHAEEEYHEALCSAKELYARPLARNYPEFHDVIFQPLADLSVVTSEHCQRVSWYVFCSLFNISLIYKKSIRDLQFFTLHLNLFKKIFLIFISLKYLFAIARVLVGQFRTRIGRALLIDRFVIYRKVATGSLGREMAALGACRVIQVRAAPVTSSTLPFS